MRASDTAPGGQLAAADDDADRWREAARLRREHPGWVVIWLASVGQYRAYPLVRARQGTALTAEEPGDLAAQITQAGQAARGASGAPCTPER